MTMGKTDLISYVAQHTNLTKEQSQKSLKAVLAGISETLVKGEEVRLIGLGTFAVQQTKAREGRNPRTGEAIKIKASKRAVFRAGKELKETLNPA